MNWDPSRSDRIANLDRLLRDLEERLTRLSRRAASIPATPRAAYPMAEAVASALSDVADRFRGRARAAGEDAAAWSDEALKFGNDTLRKITRDIEQRPLVTLGVALGIGALAAIVFARRS